MPQCPACSDSVLDTQRFCPACGQDLGISATPTGTAPRPIHRPPAATPTPGAAPASPRGSTPPSPRSGRPASTTGGSARAAGVAAPPERFAPGQLLLDRYRVIELLGKGGMGEVYRADDLKLGQSVALKFLPPALHDDAERLERFYNEARMAREVTHPAVCRVHDIGEVDGEHFLSMEYVDGEDLATLIRRIGRLPGDKATDIARQLCAGLAAAHAKGVLHRDLKPQNVMLDGRGKVRITDFGLAGLSETFQGDEVRSGTPAYMSPEQIAGREVTERSDLYALGLVLYETYTGRRPFPGRTLAEIRVQHEEPVRPPSSLVPDIAAEAEVAILRCLEADPSRRPSSGLIVSALLPGGDPLAAALAVGETPSPEMVAAAGRSTGMRPARAWACLAAIAASVAAVPFVSRQTDLVERLPEARPPAVLEDRALELLKKLGYAASPADRGRGYGADMEYYRWVTSQDKGRDQWAGLSTGEPAVVHFWYRQSPRPLVSNGSGEVHWGDPPLDVAGMAGVRLDLGGRLLSFYAIPPQVDVDPPPAAAQPADWAPLFAEAGLDPAALRPVEPRWTPPFFCDARMAWEGTYPKRPEIPLRVEAAAYRGRPVAFFLAAPWTRPERQQAYTPGRGEAAAGILFVVFLVALLVAGTFLARHHLQAGRSDRRGVFRLALVVFGLGMAEWALAAHHVLDRDAELGLLARGAGEVLVITGILVLFYLALEPYVRRFWPHLIVSWTRLLTGGVRDPLVGRDVLLGAVWGAALAILIPISTLLPGWLGYAPSAPRIKYMGALLGLNQILATLIHLPVHGAALAVSALLVMLLLKLLLRRETLAAVILCAILTSIQTLEMEAPLWLALPLGLAIMGSFTLLLLRCGLLSAIVGVTMVNMLLNFPLSGGGAWGGEPAFVVALTVVGVVGFGFRSALGGAEPARPSSA